MPTLPPTFAIALVIGRFQPLHSGQLELIRTGLAQAKRVVVAIGSAQQPRSSRNPWSAQEREQMLRACFSPTDNARLDCLALMDNPYDDAAWHQQLQQALSGLVSTYNFEVEEGDIALLSHGSDQQQRDQQQRDPLSPNTQYQENWPKLVLESSVAVCGSDIRQRFFTDPKGCLASLQHEQLLPPAVADFLADFALQPGCAQVQQELEYIAAYQQAWAAAPYAPVFVTVDSLVEHQGHILLIERKFSPGKGLWALPGGFLDPGETLLTASMRELAEETRLGLPQAELQAALVQQAVFDAPYRSARGRTITHGFYFRLAAHIPQPPVQADDDARQARWVALADIRPEQMFEDHYFIIQQLRQR